MQVGWDVILVMYVLIMCFVQMICVYNGPLCHSSARLLNICYRYSVEVNLNFSDTKSFCVAFALKHHKLSLPPLFMNTLPIMFIDSITYLHFTFT